MMKERKMMKRLLLFFVLCFALVPRARGGDDYPIKVYPCPRLEPAPAIDGSLADACWKKAPLVSGFTWYNKPKLLAVQTSFRVGYDDRYLYFGVHCDEPRAKRLTPSYAGRDSGGCFRGETIELFLDPRHDHATYHQFAVNLAGSFYDSLRSDPTWNSQSRLKTKVVADGWVLEIAIPWRDLGVKRPKAGMVVGFNVCRDRYAGGAREWSNWSQTQANFHDPDRFAHLVLSATEETLGGLAAEFRKGGRRGPVVVFAHQGYAEKAYLAMARAALKRLDAFLAQLAAEGKRERTEAARAEVARRLDAARRHVEPYRVRIRSARTLDAADWTRMSIRMAELERKLGELLWEARLAALLKDI
jgi:hypothetical protein